MNRRGKIRNIALVPVDDPGYKIYCAEQQLRNMHLTSGNSLSQISRLSVALENTVRLWVARHGGIEQRILTWEYLCSDQRYRRYYKELDFIIAGRERLMLGELKVSTSQKSLYKGRHQLIDSRSFMERLGIPVTMILVWVNIGFRHTTHPIGIFNEDFAKTHFAALYRDRTRYLFLQLYPEELYTFGRTQNIITDPRLLENAIHEAAELHCKHLLRHSLKLRELPYAEWPDNLKQDLNPPTIAQFGNSNTETLLAQKLQQAMKIG
jgi:hypothetical protein